MMKALTLKRYGGIDELEFAEIPKPTIQPDEILVQVHAVGLNPVDYMIPNGAFKPILKFKLPATMGSDVAGVVLETGSRVSRFKPGDEIFASTFALEAGTLAEYVAISEFSAALKPANLDFVQAASIPMVGLVASFERANQTSSRSEGVYPGRVRRHWYVRDSIGKTSRCQSGDNHEPWQH